MQKAKLKKMSYQELISQLKAVRSILYYYQRGRDYPGTCKLCRVSRDYHPRTSNTSACPNCLWEIIESENCTAFGKRHFSSYYYVRTLTPLPAWHKLRIPMLRRWAKVILTEMDTRTDSVEA